MRNEIFSCLSVAIMRYPGPSCYHAAEMRAWGHASAEQGYLKLESEDDEAARFLLTESGLVAFVKAVADAEDTDQLGRQLIGMMHKDKIAEIAQEMGVDLSHAIGNEPDRVHS